MSSSRCTSCGLIHQPGQCHRETSTTCSDDKPTDITPACCCACYFSIIAIFFVLFIGFPILSFRNKSCYIELFADSVSVSNANVSAADWRIGFVARSPATGCKVSINTLNARLLRGDEVISKPSYPGYLGRQFVTGDTTDVVFENVVTPEVIGDVFWNIRVEVFIAFQNDTYLNGFLIAVCPAIPVKFTTDPEGKVTGSLLGNMRRCHYEFRRTLESSD